MNVFRFEDANEFTKLVVPFLVQQEAANNLMLGLCADLKQGERRDEPPYLAYCQHEDEIVGVAVRTPPRNLVLSAGMDEDVLRAFVDDLYACYGTLPGVITPKPLSAPFTTYWQSLTGQTPKLAVAERIYQLERVTPVQNVPGTYRPMTAADKELYIEWKMALFAEAFGEPLPRQRAERHVQLRLETPASAGGLRLWCVDGQPVSIAGYTGPTPRGIRIDPVYTPPEQRGHGYGSAVTAALSQELLDSGRSFVFLFTDLANPTSNHIYQTIGYQPVCDVDEYQFV